MRAKIHLKAICEAVEGPNSIYAELDSNYLPRRHLDTDTLILQLDAGFHPGGRHLCGLFKKGSKKKPTIWVLSYIYHGRKTNAGSSSQEGCLSFACKVADMGYTDVDINEYGFVRAIKPGVA